MGGSGKTRGGRSAAKFRGLGESFKRGLAKVDGALNKPANSRMYW